jgi:hypothetical protein
VIVLYATENDYAALAIDLFSPPVIPRSMSQADAMNFFRRFESVRLAPDPHLPWTSLAIP